VPFDTCGGQKESCGSAPYQSARRVQASKAIAGEMPDAGKVEVFDKLLSKHPFVAATNYISAWAAQFGLLPPGCGESRRRRLAARGRFGRALRLPNKPRWRAQLCSSAAYTYGNYPGETEFRL
jgi:hypothetical protein